MLAATDRLAVDVQQLQSLRARARADDPEALREAARQFEALMTQTLLKTMRETRFTTEDDPLADSVSVGLYRELLDQQWAKRLAEGRGLGFAEMMVRQMSRPPTEPPAQGPLEASAAPGPTPAPPRGPRLPQADVAAPTARSEAAEDSVRAPLAPAGAAAASGKQAFLDRLRPHAEAAERATGVPARFILGHAALESGWGGKEIPRADGTSSHNLFGIKAGAGWKGAVADSLTTEYQGGLAVKRVERFRAYADYTEAFSDYGRLLKDRYGAALAAGDDARRFGAALVTGGYATDPAYADKLGRVIASVERTGG